MKKYFALVWWFWCNVIHRNFGTIGGVDKGKRLKSSRLTIRTTFKQVAAPLVISRQHFHVAKQTSEAGHKLGKKVTLISVLNDCKKNKFTET